MSNSELAGVASAAEAKIGRKNPEFYTLIEEAVRNEVKITTEKVLHIWKITNRMNIPGLQQSIIWIEEGTDRKGYQHMLKHKESFEKIGVPESKLIEVAEAATSVGKAGGPQGPGRPILGLFFYNDPIAVAISIKTNGFVVGMNLSSLDKFLEKTSTSVGELQQLYSWPKKGTSKT